MDGYSDEFIDFFKLRSLTCTISLEDLPFDNAVLVAPTTVKTAIPPAYTEEILLDLHKFDARNPTTRDHFNLGDIQPLSQWVTDNYQALEEERCNQRRQERERLEEKYTASMVKFYNLCGLKCRLSSQHIPFEEAVYISPNRVTQGLPPMYSRDSLEQLFSRDLSLVAPDPTNSGFFSMDDVQPLSEWVADNFQLLEQERLRLEQDINNFFSQTHWIYAIDLIKSHHVNLGGVEQPVIVAQTIELNDGVVCIDHPEYKGEKALFFSKNQIKSWNLTGRGPHTYPTHMKHFEGLQFTNDMIKPIRDWVTSSKQFDLLKESAGHGKNILLEQQILLQKQKNEQSKSTLEQINKLTPIQEQLENLVKVHKTRASSIPGKTEACQEILGLLEQHLDNHRELQTLVSNHHWQITQQIASIETNADTFNTQLVCNQKIESITKALLESKKELITSIQKHTKGDAALAQHDGYKQILGNLLIALTGIGLFVLAARYAVCEYGFFATNSVNTLNDIAEKLKDSPSDDATRENLRLVQTEC